MSKIENKIKKAEDILFNMFFNNLSVEERDTVINCDMITHEQYIEAMEASQRQAIEATLEVMCSTPAYLEYDKKTKDFRLSERFILSLKDSLELKVI